MFSLIRRISNSVIPRPDRPWADDPTSNAPQTGRKRRLSSTDREQDPDSEESIKKKIRGESIASSVPDVNEQKSSQAETEEVKEVTKGVKEVELTAAKPVVAPEGIPLPDEESDELDEPDSTTIPPSDTQQADAETITDDDASSVNDQSDEPVATATIQVGDVTQEEGTKGEPLKVADERNVLPVPVKDSPDPETLKKLRSATKGNTSRSKD